MDNLYEILNGDNFGIALDKNFAMKLRDLELDADIWSRLKHSAYDLANGGKIDYVEGSCLLHSTGFDSASSCTLYMYPSQYEFFCDKGWKNRSVPIAIGFGDAILYVAHNVDTEWKKEKLIKLWKNWIDIITPESL